MTSDADRRTLIAVARDSIRHGLDAASPLPVRIEDYPPGLRKPAATFVTLQSHGRLRGCIGRLEAGRPLVTDVAENAYAAAFRDPRFPPLREDEWSGLDVHISILSEPETVDADSEQELLEALEPGRDGLILSDSSRQATFLPSVWSSLPDKRDFLRELRLKAGLPADYWSSTLTVQRYRTESFSG